MTPASSPAAGSHQDHDQEARLLVLPPRVTCMKGKRIMAVLMPDLGKLVYLVIGVVVAKTVLPKVMG